MVHGPEREALSKPGGYTQSAALHREEKHSFKQVFRFTTTKAGTASAP
jgi:hypothetical protein